MAGMVDPLFGLIRLVDKIVRLKQQVRNIPDEVHRVLDAVSRARGGLQALSSVLDDHKEIFGDKFAILAGLDTDIPAFHSTLLELESFIDDYAPSTNPNATLLEVAGRTVVWIAKEYRDDRVKKLQEDIARHIRWIEESKSTLLLVATSAIARSNSVVENVLRTGNGVRADGGIRSRDDPRRGSRPQSIQTPPGESLFSSSRDSTWSSATYVDSTPGTMKPASTMASKKSSRPAFVPNGKAEIWFQGERERVPSTIQDITFKRYGDGSVARLVITDIAGVERKHNVPKNPTSQTPYSFHTREIRIRGFDSRVKRLVKFFGATEYEYSFENESDYKLFLRLTVGKTLCSYAEVESISSKRSRTPECAWQNLQLWEDDTGTRTIMFYGSGGKERQFLEFNTHLQLTKLKSDHTTVLEFTKRKTEKERTSKEELEKKMGCLEIRFTKQEDGGEYSRMKWLLASAGFTLQKR
ncbi:MAG: hypothetical protein M1840_009007 [Geoglossum simile]|nr:MAG: hypothetical protein M1840_009007 [Geoglossum simile]